MNPLLMTVLLTSTLGFFAWTMSRRMRLLFMAAPDPRIQFKPSEVPVRFSNLVTYALFQKKMPQGKYRLAGIAHLLIFGAFMVLGLNSIVLMVRGFIPDFDVFRFLHLPHVLSEGYNLIKELSAVGAILGGCVFLYYRVVTKEKRMTLSGEGLLILGIIMTMMMSDILYVGASRAIAHQGWSQPLMNVFEPFGSLVASAIQNMSMDTLKAIQHLGFWWHAGWVLLFANLLPYSKHFHVITALPNVFFAPLDHKGKLPDIVDLDGKLEREEPIGITKVEHLTWKQVLDLYTCTECGRCSENCPAYTTEKNLSPKHFTLALRDHLYDLESHFLGSPGLGQSGTEVHGQPPKGAYHRKSEPSEIVPDLMSGDVLWACTTCRACEEHCPVNISYVDKIVEVRRAEMILKNQFPRDLQKAFRGMEVNGNPWNLPAQDRGGWAKDLPFIRFAEEAPDAEVLYWVGCAAEYDDRAKKVARAVAKLLHEAEVNFAVMGSEASCTGDPARRAGNEFLFQMLAEQNVETLNGMGANKKTIVTACPHCFNTLANEYPSFGGKFLVVNHTDFLQGLVATKKLTPTHAVTAKVVYHDSCYLGRYNDVVESPREILKAIPGVELVEVPYWNKNKGLCCGAGGAQMWKEEEHGKERVNKKRTLQILDTGATKVASACPFCMTMLTDGIAQAEKQEEVQQLDIAEFLDQSVQYKRVTL